MKRPRTLDELAWKAYLDTPELRKRAASWDEMPDLAKAIWRAIARKRLAAGEADTEEPEA